MPQSEIVLNQRYRLDKKIGEGGFAQVYQGTDLQLGRQIAVKVLHANLAAKPDVLNRFQLEARAVAALDHPNILTIHDFGYSNEAAFIVMPFVTNGALDNRLRAGRLTLEQAGKILTQVGAALDYAHGAGVVHRDVKPQNILMRSEEHTLLTDFGFAKKLSNATEEAPTQALGTVHYVAPEQIRGLVSAATDQYALTVMLYQLVTNMLPFGGNAQQIMMGHLQQPPPSLTTLASMQSYDPALLRRLDAVFVRGMAKTAAERFPNCESLTAAYYQAIQTPAAGPNISQPIPAATGATIDDEPTLIQRPTVARQGPVMVRPPRLSVHTEPDQGISISFELQGENLTLGREAGNNIHLPLSIVSRRHAHLQRLGEVGPQMRYRIVDNNSRNQLRFKGHHITERILEDGDVIQIGQSGFGEYVVYLTYNAPVFR